MVTRTWTRWHSDGWILNVFRIGQDEFFYAASQHGADAHRTPARSLTDAQHQAEDIVRNSGHRCTARCSFWVPDTPDES